MPGWALQKVFGEVGSETANPSRMSVLRFGITQSKSPLGPDTSIFLPEVSSKSQSSRVCKVVKNRRLVLHLEKGVSKLIDLSYPLACNVQLRKLISARKLVKL